MTVTVIREFGGAINVTIHEVNSFVAAEATISDTMSEAQAFVVVYPQTHRCAHHLNTELSCNEGTTLQILCGVLGAAALSPNLSATTPRIASAIGEFCGCLQ